MNYEHGLCVEYFNFIWWHKKGHSQKKNLSSWSIIQNGETKGKKVKLDAHHHHPHLPELVQHQLCRFLFAHLHKVGHLLTPTIFIRMFSGNSTMINNIHSETHFLAVAFTLSDKVTDDTLCNECSHVRGPCFTNDLHTVWSKKWFVDQKILWNNAFYIVYIVQQRPTRKN